MKREVITISSITLSARQLDLSCGHTIPTDEDTIRALHIESLKNRSPMMVDCGLCALADKSQLQRTFDLRWDADMRAIKRWQAANPGNDLVWPDRADLVVWLLDRDAERAAKLKEELQRYTTGDNRTDYGRGWNCAMEEAESIVDRVLS
jgi:hypothetical protein